MQLPEEYVHSVDVSGVQSNGMLRLCLYILESQEVIWHLWRACHLAGPLQTQHQQIHDQSIVLHNE